MGLCQGKTVYNVVRFSSSAVIDVGPNLGDRSILVDDECARNGKRPPGFCGAVVSMSSVKIFTTAPLPTVGLRVLWLENDLSHGCAPLDQGMCRRRVRQRQTLEDVWFDLALAQ